MLQSLTVFNNFWLVHFRKKHYFPEKLTSFFIKSEVISETLLIILTKDIILLINHDPNKSCPYKNISLFIEEQKWSNTSFNNCLLKEIFCTNFWKIFS